MQKQNIFIEKSYVYLIFFIFIFRIALLFASPHPLFGDEAQYWAWSRDISWGYYSKPPLIAWIIRLFTVVFGDHEAIIRLPFALSHCFTAWGITKFLKDRGYPDCAGSAALIYFLLPGVFLSSQIASTDPLLLAFWSWSMVLGARLFFDTIKYKDVVLLGICLGLGLLAKYAIIWLVLGFCAALALSKTSQTKRKVFLSFLAALGLAFIIILPNIFWNAQQGWITFQHTAQNIGDWNFQKPFINLLTFIGAQIGILGPLTAWYLVRKSRFPRLPSDPTLRYLWSLSVPLLGIIAIESFIGRAYGNWAGPAFVSLIIWLSIQLHQSQDQTLVRKVLFSNAVIGMIIVFGSQLIHLLHVSPEFNPYERLYYGAHIAQQLQDREILNKSDGLEIIAVNNRSLTAQLTYIFRQEPSVKIIRWNPFQQPLDYFAMKTDLEKYRGHNVIFIGGDCLEDSSSQFFATELQRMALTFSKPHKPICVQRFHSFKGYNR